MASDDLDVLQLEGQSLGASFNGPPVQIRSADNIGVHLLWTTANAVGTFGVQITAFPNDTTSWVTLPQTLGTVAGANDTAFTDINQTAAPWMRIIYTRTSGTGTLVGAAITGKGL